MRDEAGCRAFVEANGAHIDQRRRRWWGEQPIGTRPEPDLADADGAAVDSRDGWRRLLADLPARDRAVIVLHYS